MRKLAQLILFSFIIFSLIYIIGFSPLFIIDEVDVRGTDLPREQILETAGLAPGQNLLFYRTETGISNLLRDARFRSVMITKEYPNRLLINIDSRQPFVNIYQGGNTITLDSSGLVIEINQPDETLVQLRGFTVTEASLGEPIVSTEAATLKKALDLANLVTQTTLSDCMISYEDSHLLLHIGDTWKIKFGSANQIEEQFSAFKALYDQLVDQGTTGGVVDVTNASIAVFKPFE